MTKALWKLRRAAIGGTPPAEPPALLEAPALSGTAIVGGSLAVSNGVFSNAPTSHAYKWQTSADGLTGWADVSGQTANTLLLTGGYAGLYARGLVRAANAAGLSDWKPSASSGQIAASVPSASDIVVGAAWYAADGGASQWGGSPPDPSISYAARSAAGSLQQPAINIMTRWSQVYDEPLAIGVQVVLFDAREDSPTVGQRVPCTLRWHAPGASGDVTAETTRTGTDLKGRPWSKRRHWVDLQVPADEPSLLEPVPASEGAYIDLYFEAIPQWEGFDSRLVGPFRYYPRNANGWAEVEVHKSGAGAGADYSALVAAYGSVPARFTSTGKATRIRMVDTGHDWEVARAAASHICPFWTEVVPGLDTVTGLQATYTLGDHAAFPNAGYSSPGIARLVFKGCDHDIGKTGGIVCRNSNQNEIAFEDHDTFCTSYPAGPVTIGTTTYPKYGTGTGQSALVLGRQPPAAVKPSGTGYSMLASTNGYWHDLPGTALSGFTIDDDNWGHDISGTPIENRMGGVWGGHFSRFGGFYSGLITLPGDDNPGMALTKTGTGEWWVSTRLVTGNNGNYLDFFYDAGGVVGSATLVESFVLKQYEYVAELVARINASTALAAITATDITGDVELDQTHIQVSGGATTTPVPKTALGAGLNMILNRDIHAACMSLNMTTLGQRRRNLSALDRRFFEYCGSASTVRSMIDGTGGEPAGTIAIHDDYIAGCGFHDDAGYFDRNNDWRYVHPEKGYNTGGVDGTSLVNCSFTSPVSTAACGVQFGSLAAHNTIRHAVVAYTYGEIGAFDFLEEMTVIGCVSPYQSLPAGTVNSKFIGTTGVTKDPDTVFTDAGAGDWTLLAGTSAQTPDGLSWAGIFDNTGARPYV